MTGVSHLQVRPSRLGVHVGFIALFAALGGALRGLNLLIVLAGLLFGLLLIQWRVCRRALEGVRLQRQLPQEAVAGVPFQVRFLIRNLSSWLPTWLLGIEEAIHTVAGGAALARGSSAVAFLAARSSGETHYDCRIAYRGCYRFGPATLASGFPFGLIIARRTDAAPLSEPLYVYPRLLQLRPPWRSLLDARSSGLASTRSQSGPSEGDFYGLRSWQTGDSRRWIHWRTTARTDHPAVRQFELQRRYELSILVDAARLNDDPAAELAVERTISLAATLVARLATLPNSRITLVTAGRQVRSLLVTNRPELAREALKLLAELEGTATPPLAEAMATALQADGGRNRPVLILSPRPARNEYLMAPPPDRGEQPGDRPADPPSRRWMANLGHLDLRWLDIHSDAAKRIVQWENADATA